MAAELGTSRSTLAELATQIDVIATDSGGLGPTFDALDATAVDVQARADAARDRIGLDL